MNFILKITDYYRKKFLCKYSKIDRSSKIQTKNIGNRAYIGKNCIINGRDTKIGNWCTIEDEVIIGSESLQYNNFSVNIKKEVSKPVIIENDVKIGYHSVICGGIKIGNGAIIEAFSIVTEDVPDYAVVEGMPAKITKYRFDEVTIKELLKLKWWDLDENLIKKLPFDDVSKCIKILKEPVDAD